MNLRRAAFVACLGVLAACKRPAPVGALGDAAAEVASECPKPVHPDYCEGKCREWSDRTYTLHAHRIRRSGGASLGTCGPYRVFAETDLDANDAGIVEFYDQWGVLVAAEDRRGDAGCNTYGRVPSCEPSLKPRPLGTIAVSEVTVGAPYDATVVTKIVEQNFGRFHLAFNTARMRDGDFHGGAVNLGFVISREGDVKDTKSTARTTAGQEAFVAAIVADFASISFPPPTAPVAVSMTLTFTE